MWMTLKMLAFKHGCSEDTIRRRMREMEASGLYPRAVRRLCGVEIDSDALEDFCTIRRGIENGGKSEVVCGGGADRPDRDRTNFHIV